MDIATTLALIIFTICITAPAIITALEQAGIFQRRSKCIKELEKKIEELKKQEVKNVHITIMGRTSHWIYFGHCGNYRHCVTQC